MKTDHLDIIHFCFFTSLADDFHLTWTKLSNSFDCLRQSQQTKSIVNFSQSAKFPGISRDSSKFLYYDTYKYLRKSILHTYFSDNV